MTICYEEVALFSNNNKQCVYFIATFILNNSENILQKDHFWCNYLQGKLGCYLTAGYQLQTKEVKEHVSQQKLVDIQHIFIYNWFSKVRLINVHILENGISISW